MSEKLLQRIFQKVYGNPSWLVRQRSGPSIVMEFGKPKLHIWECLLKPWEKGRRRLMRVVRARGNWSLTTFSSDWCIWQRNRKICDSHSNMDRINRGCNMLDGQILTKTVVRPKTLATDFYFDLGGHMQATPHQNQDEPSSLWDLFCPNGRVFSLKSDGNYSYCSGKLSFDKVRRVPFTLDLQ